MNWKIGMKVVCVESDGALYLRNGATYTIKIIEMCGCGDMAFGLSEITRPVEGQRCYRCNTPSTFRSYHAYRFRPLISDWAEEVLTNSLPKEHPVFSKIKERVEK